MMKGPMPASKKIVNAGDLSFLQNGFAPASLLDKWRALMNHDRQEMLQFTDLSLAFII